MLGPFLRWSGGLGLFLGLYRGLRHPFILWYERWACMKPLQGNMDFFLIRAPRRPFCLKQKTQGPSHLCVKRWLVELCLPIGKLGFHGARAKLHGPRRCWKPRLLPGVRTEKGQDWVHSQKACVMKGKSVDFDFRQTKVPIWVLQPHIVYSIPLPLGFFFY